MVGCVCVRVKAVVTVLSNHREGCEDKRGLTCELQAPTTDTLRAERN